MLKRGYLLYILGLLFCAVPPALATVAYFPLWTERGAGATLSGGALLLLIICAIPLIRHIKKLFVSPSAYIVWLVIFLAFYSLSSIADEVTVIAFVGFIGNLIGAILFALAKRIGGKNEKLQ